MKKMGFVPDESCGDRVLPASNRHATDIDQEAGASSARTSDRALQKPSFAASVTKLVVIPLAFFATGAGLLLLANSFGLLGGDSGIPVEKDSTQFTQPAELVVGATTLYAEYDINSIAADEKYKGKRVEVKGIVRKFGTDVQGNPYFILTHTSSSEYGVQCTFDSSWRHELSNMRLYRNVKVRGFCQGRFGNVQVSDCSFEVVSSSHTDSNNGAEPPPPSLSTTEDAQTAVGWGGGSATAGGATVTVNGVRIGDGKTVVSMKLDNQSETALQILSTNTPDIFSVVDDSGKNYFGSIDIASVSPSLVYVEPGASATGQFELDEVIKPESATIEFVLRERLGARREFTFKCPKTSRR